MLTLTTDLLMATTTDSLKKHRERIGRFTNLKDDKHFIDPDILSRDDLASLRDLALTHEAKSTARALDSILLSRSGVFDKSIPNFQAFKGSLTAYLRLNLINGWIFVEASDGKLYPELVTSVDFVEGRRDGSPDCVQVRTKAYSLGNGRLETISKSHQFVANDATRKTIHSALAGKGIHKETHALIETYDKEMQRYVEIVAAENASLGKQFEFTGTVHRFKERPYDGRNGTLIERKVVKDCDPSENKAIPSFDTSSLAPDDTSFPVPRHPLLRLFDLRTHEFFWANADYLKNHRYDMSLKDKLILPKSHRDLLDVMTTNLDAFVDDFIKGKSAGNIILCKGIPGVGKTLTAEVYSTLTQKPLYSIHAGSLGTSAATIEASLATIMQRAKRWGCIILLDEADVFVSQRGQDIVRNAIVAEFLRTLEYFDGLMFLTTNRPDDIDDAIISRCAAIIEYQTPSPIDSAQIWRIMATQFGTTLREPLIDQLVSTFPTITPRDIKMLLRLALRIAEREQQLPDIDTFRRCAMFRAIKIADGGDFSKEAK